jgi:hypothetical protein
MHYSESNIVMLNIMSLVFTRMPEKAPFFIKPLLRAIQAKAEQGILSLSQYSQIFSPHISILSTNPYSSILSASDSTGITALRSVGKFTDGDVGLTDSVLWTAVEITFAVY